jgi:hypothetical protein
MRCRRNFDKFDLLKLLKSTEGTSFRRSFKVGFHAPYTLHGPRSLPPYLIRPVAVTRRRVFGMFAGAAAAVGVPSAWISNEKL